MSGREVPWFAVINLSNSIIGVSILAMPWCFRECGVVLATLLIIFGGFMTRLSCNLLLRASKASRRQTYEYLAYHTLGATGKLAVEMSIIGLLVCSCIAFFTIMGDLGPAIVSKWAGFENNQELRVSFLVFVAFTIILPLGLRRSVESLSNISTISIMFYMIFSCDIILNSLPVLTSGVWLKDLVLWRSAGTLKGLSIFALAFSCQTVLFVVYNTLPVKNPYVMEAVVSKAIKMVGLLNVVVGFFGYVTFNQSGIKGDILLNFAPGMVSEVLRLGFTLSVALSFPLAIFPCRASIYTLFFSHSHSLENPHGGGGEYIPPSMFKLITFILVVFTLVLGITIPNVEVILGLTGATLGCLICFIFPALIYLRTNGVPNKSTGKIVLTIGVLILVCSTYDNLQSMQKEADIDIPRLDIEEEVKRLEQAANQFALNKAGDKPALDGNHDIDEKQIADLEKEPKVVVDNEEEKLKSGGKDHIENEERREETDQDDEKDQPKEPEVVNEQRREPPIPHAPADKDIKAKPPEKQVEIQEDNEEEESDDILEEEGKEKERELIQQGDGDESKKEEEDREEVEGAKVEDRQDEEPMKKAEDTADEDKEDEDKAIEQEHRQEEQDKQLKEIKEKQEQQEQLIKQQAEELEKLRIQHEEEQKEKEKEKIEKEREEREKLLKEKEELEHKMKQEALLKQQEELQKKQQVLQIQQEIQQQQQQQQQQLGGGGFGGQVGLGQDQFQQPVGGVLGGLDPVNQGPQQLPQDGGGFVAPNLNVEQQQQQIQQAVPGDGMAGGLLQQQPVLDGGVIQQQIPVVGQQQQAGIPQQMVQQQQPGILQQQPQAGGMGQPIGVGGQIAAQQQVGGQMPLPDGGFGQGMQPGGVDQLQGQVQQQQQGMPQQQQQGMPQQQQQGMPQQPLDRQQRSAQDIMGPGIQQEQVGGVPQQGMVGGGLSQMQQQQILQQQQNLQLNNQQQQMVPIQGEKQQILVNPDGGIQQPNQMLQQQQMDQGPIVQQQQQVDPQVLGMKNLEQNIKPIIPVGIDSNAANRQLKHANTEIPKISKTDVQIKKSDDLKADFDKTEIDRTNDGERGLVKDNTNELLQGDPDDIRHDGEAIVPKERKDHYQVLVEDKEDVNMELANSLEQQMNNQFKQVGAIAHQEKTYDNVKMNTRRKEEVK